MRDDNTNRLDPISILREEATAAALAHGADRCDELVDNLVRRYINRVGGLPLYIRQAKSMERQRVHAEIRERFNGVNLAELSRDYGLSPRHLRRILEA